MNDPVIPARPAQLGGPWRWLLPLLLVLLFLAVLAWLPWQARQMESNERQEQLIADTLWVEQTIRFELTRTEESLAALAADLAAAPGMQAAAPGVQARLAHMLKTGHELQRLLWIAPDGHVLAAAGAAVAGGPAAFAAPSRAALEVARKTGKARYSEPYSPSPGAPALVDYHLPVAGPGAPAGPGGSLVATHKLKVLLDETVPWWFAQDNAL
ncbi:MAG TPA: PAS domain-containing sensor histidine kinase, partial [Telluria sp.]